MAHKKGGGSSVNGRDSQGQRLGVKLFGGQAIRAGHIIVRQRGTKIHAGEGVGVGKDHTLYATQHGFVKFDTLPNGRKIVSIAEAATAHGAGIVAVEAAKAAAAAAGA